MIHDFGTKNNKKYLITLGSCDTFDEDTKTFVPKQTETEDRYQTQGEYGKQGSATSELQDDPNRNKV